MGLFKRNMDLTAEEKEIIEKVRKEKEKKKHLAEKAQQEETEETSELEIIGEEKSTKGGITEPINHEEPDIILDSTENVPKDNKDVDVKDTNGDFSDRLSELVSGYLNNTPVDLLIMDLEYMKTELIKIKVISELTEDNDAGNE